jgi:23S rRNA (adenine2030-N6)-methyltransferase
LLQLVDALQKKAKGFLYLDTHAGEGAYDLAGADARQGAESAAGIQRLERQLAGGATTVHPAIRRYLDAVERIRGMPGNSRLTYPGSPLLVAMALRPVDQALCIETQPQAARALHRAFEHHAALLGVHPRVVTGDGYHEVKSALPPASRRGLILIDPPYESQDEEQHAAAALADGLERFETGVFALWYPIKKQHEAELFTARVTRGITRPTVALELCVRAPDNAAGLNGSGMLVVNPPWQLDAEAATWQSHLHTLLGGTSGGSVRWLVHESSHE